MRRGIALYFIHNHHMTNDIDFLRIHRDSLMTDKPYKFYLSINKLQYGEKTLKFHRGKIAIRFDRFKPYSHYPPHDEAGHYINTGHER